MRASHERVVSRLAIAVPIPAFVVAMWLLWSGDFFPRLQWTVSIILGIVTGALVAKLRGEVLRPLMTLSNMLAAIREHDYSLRARHANPEDAMGLAMFEVNELMNELRERRLGALDAAALLQRVITEIDVAVFAFDDIDTLRVVNVAGERLLAQPKERLIGKSAQELGLAVCLTGEVPRLSELVLNGKPGRWEVRRGLFHQGGRQHQFVLLADVSRSLREEERQAWQRIIRVLSHEINNSMTPIRSLAQRLQELLQRKPADGELREDLQRGLSVIATRSEGLSRFLSSYARLVRLPPPRLVPLDVSTWVQRVVRLELRLPVQVDSGPPITLTADGDQLDQLLINLVSNAVDAAMATGGGVSISWTRADGQFVLSVRDEGPGLPETAGNLFVPFFTTKPSGTGIGLALSRQIAEAHGGTVTLDNRRDGPGCEARVILPL